MLHTSRNSLPAGQRTCRPCRRARPKPKRQSGPAPKNTPRTCAICGGGFMVRCPAVRTRACSPPCAQELATRIRREPGPCADCGQPTIRGGNTVRLCLGCAATRRRAHYRAKNERRHRGVPCPSRQLSITELGDRDSWKCHLCQRKVNPNLRSPHPQSATMDHLVPVADGGDSEPENLRLAHRRCNTRRGTRGTVQLLLVG